MPYLLVKNRDKTLFNGTIENVSSYNKIGLFNILVDHSNFISIIEKQIIIAQSGGRQQVITLANGLLKVRENKIFIYLGVK
jgi:F0F1-type ATP synthase epsilon subunit